MALLECTRIDERLSRHSRDRGFACCGSFAAVSERLLDAADAADEFAQFVWFERRRGMVSGVRGVFVSLGFSIAPLLLALLIDAYGWRGAL